MALRDLPLEDILANVLAELTTGLEEGRWADLDELKEWHDAKREEVIETQLAVLDYNDPEDGEFQALGITKDDIRGLLGIGEDPALD